MKLSPGVRTRKALIRRLLVAELLAPRGQGPLALRRPRAGSPPPPARSRGRR